MRKILLVVVVIICLLIMTGCNQIDYGTVTDKSFRKAHRTYQPMIMHVNKATRIFPRWINHPDNWVILVENGDGSEWWEVTEEFYNSVEIGSKVDRRGATPQ